MKTDKEMIESLFRRRDEYYKKMSRKNTILAALKITGGIALPLAAAGAAALFLIFAQNNIVFENIDSDISAGAADCPLSQVWGIYNGVNALDPYEISGKNKKSVLDTAPLCISFEGTIYKLEEEADFSAAAYPINRFTEAGTARVLESDPEYGECTVYNIDGGGQSANVPNNSGEQAYDFIPADMKAVFFTNGIGIYKAVGSSSYMVEGIRFDITALHRTSKKYRASRLPIFKENDDVIFRAYDLYGRSVNDAFILYTPALDGVSDFALWEVTAEYSYEPVYNSSISLENYFDFTCLCSLIQKDELLAADLIALYGCNVEIAVNNYHLTSGIQIYYTDPYRTEYVLEAYEHSDDITLSRVASGETVYLTDPDCDYEAFLSPYNVPDAFKDECEDTADTVSRLLEMYGSDTLTVKDLEDAGFRLSETYPDRYELFFDKNGERRAAAVFMDEEGNFNNFMINDFEIYYERYYFEQYCDEFVFLKAD